MFFYNEGDSEVSQIQTPSIVTDGLTFNIDPSDPQSYSGGSIIYDTVNNHSSQLHGGVTIEQTNNGILSFDGIDDYLNFGSFMTLSTFTIVMAVKPGNTQVQYADIFDNNHKTYRNFVFQQDGLNTNYYSAVVPSAGGVDITLDPSKWQIVTMVFINQNKLAVYKDDLLIGSAIPGSINVTGQSFNIARWHNDGNGGRHWNGRMGFFKIYDRALTDAEVLQNFEATKTRFGL